MGDDKSYVLWIHTIALSFYSKNKTCLTFLFRKRSFRLAVWDSRGKGGGAHRPQHLKTEGRDLFSELMIQVNFYYYCFAAP